ncbi:hypothetical protein CT0861_10543 [Colletotrichum tofieldiae]|uniref:Uncharacterized protein n=1 Tax=Colletotrichum tofieldiae TaxID=708197 RepID=A0A166VIY4_9PEZI|nr:hypothetical protein CT0861_10543 [Colletotrichum tofieldiae]GKT84125.1 hypothetical protein Ct61P_01975 [Colletotrichum tofieldiae]
MENSSQSAATTASPMATNLEEALDHHALTVDGTASNLVAPSVSAPKLPSTFRITYGRLGREHVYTVMSPDYDALCTILVDIHWYSSSFTLKMVGGDSRNHGVSATARGKVGAFFGRSFLEVSLPSIFPTQPLETNTTMKSYRTTFRSSLCGFSMMIGGKEEHFEWRRTNNTEAKPLGKALHRKLVRIPGPNVGAGNFKMRRDVNPNNDGKEVVAFMADNSSWNLGRSFTFRFRESGLESTLSEQWRTAALLSGLWLWWMDLVRCRSLVASGGTVFAIAGVAVVAGVAT